MRRLPMIVVFGLLTLSLVGGQTQHPYRVVFDLTSTDSLDQAAVMRWVKEIGAASPAAELEVVMYGKGVELVALERSSFVADVREAMANPNVSFKACAVALKNNKVDKRQLVPGVQVVPDAIYEIISKQQDHWGYIKVAH